jgi:hypothetical protein
MRGITRDLFQHPPLHFQDSKWPFNDIPKRRMRIIEDLIFTFWLWGITVLLQMILGSLVRCKVTCLVRVPEVHKVIFAYTIKQLLVSWSSSTMYKCSSNWLYGCENTWLYVVLTSLNTLISCIEPGQPTRTNVHLMSKSHIAKTFCVVIPLRHRCYTNLSLGTTQGTWVPSIAPIQSLK